MKKLNQSEFLRPPINPRLRMNQSTLLSNQRLVASHSAFNLFVSQFSSESLSKMLIPVLHPLISTEDLLILLSAFCICTKNIREERKKLFVKNADCGVAGQRRSREKLIQAPLLTQNLKKFPTRCCQICKKLSERKI